MELHPREQSLLFQFKKFGCLSTEAVAGSGAAKRDNPFTFRRGMEAVSPVDLQEPTSGTTRMLSERMSHVACQEDAEAARARRRSPPQLPLLSLETTAPK